MARYVNQAARFDAALKEEILREVGAFEPQPNVADLDGAEDVSEVEGKVNEILATLRAANIIEE